jgi:hypothetical protein
MGNGTVYVTALPEDSRVLLAEGGSTRDIAWSPNGKTLACSYNNRLRHVGSSRRQETGNPASEPLFLRMPGSQRPLAAKHDRVP